MISYLCHIISLQWHITSFWYHIITDMPYTSMPYVSAHNWWDGYPTNHILLLVSYFIILFIIEYLIIWHSLHIICYYVCHTSFVIPFIVEYLIIWHSLHIILLSCHFDVILADMLLYKYFFCKWHVSVLITIYIYRHNKFSYCFRRNLTVVTHLTLEIDISMSF